jgi:hypothetical protein
MACAHAKESLVDGAGRSLARKSVDRRDYCNMTVSV